MEKCLIDAEKVISDLAEMKAQLGVDAILIDGMIDGLKRQPKVDAVEVVRKPVRGYEGYYEVDQFGRVFGLERIIKVNDNGRNYEKPIAGKQLKQSMHTKGYKTVSLTKDGKTKTLFVHRIVAEAFIPNVDNLPMVNHKDEDKTNNFVENLEWCTNDYNINYGTRIGRFVKSVSKQVMCVETGEIFNSIKEAHEKTGITASCISGCVNHKKRYRTARRFHWQFV